jgi:ABC-type nitrate/sulfonate/bicarbonate transport system permease component
VTQSPASAVRHDSSARTPSRRRRSIRGRVADAVAPYAIIGVLLAGWQIAASWQLVMPFLLPPPSAVLRWIADDVLSGTLVTNIALTLYRTLMGFALAAIIGVAIGILMTRMVSVRWFFDPILSFGLPLPKVALLPVFMLWFGLFDTSKILMVAFSACFQIVISTWHGTQGVERELLWSARSLGATDRELLWEIVLPAALPQILTGLQIAMPICLIVVLITEMQMGGQGLGDSMLAAARYAKTAGVFAGIIEIGAVGLCVIKLMELIRRRLLAWHQETLREETTV